MKSESPITKQYLVISKRTVLVGVIFAFIVISGIFTFSKTAHASLFSFVTSIFSQNASAKVNQIDSTASAMNAQNIALLQPAVNPDPNPNKTIDIVPVTDGETLVPDMVSSDAASTTVNAQISTYTVRPGDTLETIAKMFGVSINTILWSNDITYSSKIQIGQTLVILPVSGIRYTVKSGDTIANIVKKYNADVNDITTYNDLSTTTLIAGQSIVIPYAEEVSMPSNSSGSSSSGSSVGSKTVPYEPLLDSVCNLHSYPGYFIRPVSGGYVSQDLHGHNAIDFAVPKGTPIVASAAGTVIISRINGAWNGGYGNFVVISHPNNTQTLYAHMLSNKVTVVGEQVAQGQTIGYIGMTGLTTGPHVHFEVRGARNPFSIKPLNFCK